MYYVDYKFKILFKYDKNLQICNEVKGGKEVNRKKYTKVS